MTPEGSLRPYNRLDGSGRRSFKDNVASGSLGAIVRTYKSTVALRYNRMRLAEHGPFWQRNYCEHIFRNACELQRIHRYILNNPLQWELDQENPFKKTS